MKKSVLPGGGSPCWRRMTSPPTAAQTSMTSATQRRATASRRRATGAPWGPATTRRARCRHPASAGGPASAATVIRPASHHDSTDAGPGVTAMAAATPTAAAGSTVTAPPRNATRAICRSAAPRARIMAYSPSRCTVTSRAPSSTTTAPIAARLTNNSDRARCTASSVATNGGRITVSPLLRLTTNGLAGLPVTARLELTELATGRYEVACSLRSSEAAWSAVTPPRSSGKLHRACSGSAASCRCRSRTSAGPTNAAVVQNGAASVPSWVSWGVAAIGSTVQKSEAGAGRPDDPGDDKRLAGRPEPRADVQAEPGRGARGDRHTERVMAAVGGHHGRHRARRQHRPAGQAAAVEHLHDGLRHMPKPRRGGPGQGGGAGGEPGPLGSRRGERQATLAQPDGELGPGGLKQCRAERLRAEPGQVAVGQHHLLRRGGGAGRSAAARPCGSPGSPVARRPRRTCRPARAARVSHWPRPRCRSSRATPPRPGSETAPGHRVPVLRRVPAPAAPARLRGAVMSTPRRAAGRQGPGGRPRPPLRRGQVPPRPPAPAARSSPAGPPPAPAGTGPPRRW